MFTRCHKPWLSLLVLPVVLAGCGPNGPAIAEPPPPPVSVSQPVEKEVTDQDDYEGRIAAVKTVEVRARVRGELTKVLFKDGQLVKEGEPLFEIDPRPYQAQLDATKAMIASADASLEHAKTQYARILRLVNNKAATREELDEWTAKQDIAKADRLKAEAEMQKAKLDLGFCKITAPIAGRISRPLVTEGNLVNAAASDTLLTTIVATDPLYVYFNVDERALVRYRRDFSKEPKLQGAESIKELKIPVFVAIEGDADFTQKGTIDFVENKVNSGTGTIQVRGILNNPNRLLDDGMRARVRVPVSDPHKALLIAERAIGTDQGLKFVYVVNADKVVERRDVQPGRSFDGLVAIKSGLKPKEWVIVNGIQRVREGIKVDPKEVPMPGAVLRVKCSAFHLTLNT